MGVGTWLSNLLKPKIYKWPLLPGLAAFKTATFDQRQILLSLYRADERIPVGACPGLSLAWIQEHARWPNQTSVDRMATLDTAAIWSDAADYTASFNADKISPYAKRVSELLLIDVNPPNIFDLSATISNPGKNIGLLCTSFDPANKYALVMFKLVGGSGVNHLCASFSYLDEGVKYVLLFDPNYGEFKIELTNAPMTAFVAACIAQFQSFRAGRDGKAAALKIESIEVIQLKNVVGTRPRSRS